MSIDTIVKEMISTAFSEFDFEKHPSMNRVVEKVFNNFDFSEEFSKMFKEMDLEDEVRAVIDDYNFEDIVTNVIDEYDFASKMEAAIEDVDLDAKIVSALEDVGLDGKIDAAIESVFDNIDIDRKIERAVGEMDLGTELRHAIKNSRVMHDYIDELVDRQLRESDAIGRLIDERVAKALAEKKPEPKFENLEKIDKLVTFLTQLFK